MNSFVNSFQMKKGILASSLYLAEQTLLKIGQNTSDKCLIWLNQVFTVFLKSIEFFEDMKEDSIIQSIHKVCSDLGLWIEKSQVLCFGASSFRGTWHGNCAASEIKVSFNCM